jgi:hypothetical protein
MEFDRIYVFVSNDGLNYGLSTHADGGNIPRLVRGATWLRHDASLITTDALAKCVARPTLAKANLKARGYHIGRRTALRLRDDGNALELRRRE